MVRLDRRKFILLGLKSQEDLLPWLDRDPEKYCFVPAETSAWHYRRLCEGLPREFRRGQRVANPQAPLGPEAHRAQQPGRGRAGSQSGRDRGMVASLAATDEGDDDPPGMRPGGGQGLMGHANSNFTEDSEQWHLELAMRIMRVVVSHRRGHRRWQTRQDLNLPWVRGTLRAEEGKSRKKPVFGGCLVPDRRASVGYQKGVRVASAGGILAELRRARIEVSPGH